MGGLLKSSKPKPTQTVQVATPVETPTADTTTSSASEASGQEQRIESLKRQARGRAATIATSSSGLLTLASTEPTRKSLLGE